MTTTQQAETGGTASTVRALQLLDVFTGDNSLLGVSEIARLAGLPTSTTHRLLSHLVRGELLAKIGTDYRLSDRMFELGNQVTYSRPHGVRNVAGPFMGEVFGMTGLTTHLAVLEGSQILLVDKIARLQTRPARAVVGGRYSAVCTALGKSLLAFQPELQIHKAIATGLPRRTRYSMTKPSDLLQQLAEVRASRIATEYEESTLGQHCIASPIFNDGHAIAAIGISGGTTEVDLPKHRALLIRAASQVSNELTRASTVA